jgi:GNAT superfamily N-acetyltransferase
VAILISQLVASEHLDEIVAVILQVRREDATYPPARIVLDGPESAERWLMGSEPRERLVALVGGHAVGHVAIGEPWPYLAAALDRLAHSSAPAGGVAELGQLFVSPRFRRAGVGRELLKAACSVAARMGKQPALAVLEGAQGARRLYEREGLRDVGSFTGLDGRNHVFVLDPGRGNPANPDTDGPHGPAVSSTDPEMGARSRHAG